MDLRFKIGLVFVVLLLTFGFIVYLFSPGGVMSMNTYGKNLPVSREHWLGTTQQGQDIFWLLVESLHNSLIIGFLVAIASTAAGVFIGLFAGFVGGFVERAILFVSDVLVIVPRILILIMLGALLHGRATIYTISGILILFDWPGPARQARSMALKMKHMEFINTARFSGENLFKIVYVEILPHVLSWALATFVNLTLRAIESETALAIFGLSSVTTPTLGNMIYWARSYNAMILGRWLWIGSPIVVIAVLFISLFFVYNGYNRYMARKRGYQG